MVLLPTRSVPLVKEFAMTTLRTRMMEDMQVRNLSRHTQDSYLLQVSQFARHFARSPDLLGPEDIRAYQVYLTNEKKLAPRSVHVTVAALRFLYRVTLGLNWDFDRIIPCPKAPKTLAVILSPEEVLHVLSCIESLKHQAILTTCYAAGLRISEATRLKPIGAPCDPQGYGCFPAPLLENRYRQAPWMPPAAGCIGCRNSPSR